MGVTLQRLDGALVQFFDGSADGALVVDGEGIIRYANGAARELLAGGRDLRGVLVEELVPPLQREAHRGYRLGYRLAKGRRMGAGRRLLARTLDGEHLHVTISLTPLDEGLTVAVVRDDTAAREREAQLFRAQRLCLVGELVGGVAHDMNNLLTVLLLTRDPDLVQAAVDRARLLGSQLVGLARGGRGAALVVDPVAQVEQLFGLLEPTLPSRVGLRLCCAPGVRRVHVHGSDIPQIVLNLVVNARDAMPAAGGSIRVELGEVERAEPPEADARPYIRLSVIDTGRGMSPATLTRMFEPGFTTKPEGQGTGLGLAVVRRVVDEAGGHIEVQSEPGSGTRVDVYLPSTGAPVGTVAPEPDAALLRGDGEAVLMIEPDALVREAVSADLLARGFAVTAVGDERAAWTAIESGAHDLVLIDAAEPSAAKLAARAVERTPGAITLITGELRDLVSAAAWQPDGVLAKPYTALQLAAAIRLRRRAP